MLHRRVDVFLIADDPVRQDGFEIRAGYVPSVEPPANLDLETQCVFVRKNKFTDGTKPNERLFLIHGAT